nr:tetratricopeptide repeat protein [Myxococcota bacterium]
MRRAASIAAVLFAVLAVVSSADAQRRRRAPPTPTDPLQAAEQAYVEVDFERTLEHASAALQAGGHSPDRLARIYQLLGVSAAALGDPDGARDFFERMLAIDPDATLDDTVPPRLRAPFLEARGVVSARTDELGAQVGIARTEGGAVRVALTDPFGMARMVRVHARLEGGAEYTSAEAESGAEVLMPLPGADTADRVEYWVEVLDPYGNQLAILGSEFEPRTVGRIAVVGGGGAGAGGEA